MRMFMVVILASAALQTSAVTPTSAVIGPAGTLVPQKSGNHDENPLIMRREDAAALVEEDEATVHTNKADEKLAPQYSQYSSDSTRNVRVIEGEERPFGPIPKEQKPFWAFLLFAIIGFIGYSINNWRMRSSSKMRAAAAVTGAETPDTNGLPTTLWAKVFGTQKGKGGGKGFGKALGKSTGKATSKGSKGAPEERRQSSSPSNEGTFSMSKLWAFLPFLANGKAVGSKGGKAVGKGKKGKASESSMMKDLISVVRSVEKIQAVWRRFIASQPAPPNDNQRITVVCDVLQGKDMPNVNRFGGCDPFVECRIVKGDPTHRLRGDLDKEPLLTAQTDMKRNDLAPSWNQKLSLADLTYDKDMYVQLVLWDYNLAGNKPVGHVSLPLSRALSAYGPKRPERALSFTSLPGCEEEQLKATVSAKFSFLDTSPTQLS